MEEGEYHFQRIMVDSLVVYFLQNQNQRQAGVYLGAQNNNNLYLALEILQINNYKVDYSVTLVLNSQQLVFLDLQIKHLILYLEANVKLHLYFQDDHHYFQMIKPHNPQNKIASSNSHKINCLNYLMLKISMEALTLNILKLIMKPQSVS